MKKGFSVIEILVVIGVFAVLGVLATQSISLSLRASKKSGSTVNVKQELDYAASTIERQLQTASTVIIGKDCLTDHTATPSVGFRNSAGTRGDIACVDSSPSNFIGSTNPRIASSSGETVNYNQRLTSDTVAITECSFKCYATVSKTYVDFYVTASAKGITDTEGATVTTSRKILIRSANRR